MKVRNCWCGDITKGDEEGIISNIEDGYINFEDRGDIKFYPEYFKPANKFEVGDEVIWQNDKVKIWGIRYDDEIKEYEYAIEDFLENVGRTIVFESELSPLKKKDELEVGDKFRSVGNRTIKVLDKKFDELHNEMVYFGKCENGLISVWSEYEVDEIIYE